MTVLQGENTLFEVENDGTIVRSEIAHFRPILDRRRWTASWRPTASCTGGPATASSPASRTSADRSGAFLIREVYEGSDGERRYIVLDDEDI